MFDGSLLDAAHEAALDALPANVMVADRNLVVRFANRTARATLAQLEPELVRVFGVRVAEIIGGSAHRFHEHPERVEAVLRALGDKAHEARFSFGSVVLDTKITRFGDRGYVVLWEDVSALAAAHRRAEVLNEELAEKNDRLSWEGALLRRAAAVTGSGTVLMNYHTGHMRGSSGLADVLQVAADGDGQRAFLALVADVPVLDEAVASCLAEGQPFDLDVEAEMRGRPTWLHVSGRQLADPSSGEPCLLGVVQNIDTRKRYERDLEERSAALAIALRKSEAGMRIKTGFLANMSHELRTPLNAILGSVALLRPHVRSHEEAEVIEVLCAGARELEHVLEEILVVSDAETGQLQIQGGAFVLSDLLDDLLLEFESLAADKQVKLLLEIASTVPDVVEGDARRFRQVVAALLSNAIKFSRRGHVWVEVEGGDGGGIELRVVDDGIGIDPVAQVSIFEAFAQVSEGNTRRFGGTGLGLTVAHRLTRAMGGELHLQSELGSGSAFSVTIKFAKASFQSEGGRLSGVFYRWRGSSTVGGEVRNLRAAGARAAVTEEEQALDIWMRAAGDDVDDAAAGLHVWPRGSTRPQSGAASRHLTQPVARQTLISAALDVLERGLSRPDTSPSKELAVLVVDDVATNRLIVRRLLTQLGVEVVVAEGGAEAVRACEMRSFDLVLMDLQMPVVDGFEATRQILERQPGTFVAALTANVLAEHRRASEEVGMRAFLTKPVQIEALQAILRDLQRSTPAR